MTATLNGRAPSFVPWDIEVARINFGANCGPASFAAITGKEVCRVMAHFLHFEHSRWTNLTQMRRAFEDAGYVTMVRKRALPGRGVALVQWLGPWTERDFFSRWSLVHTHWVAVQGGWIFDHTVGAWETLLGWRERVAPEFIAEIPGATGWAVKYGVEIAQGRSGCAGSGDAESGSSLELALNLSS
jgi:hypothetical protein